MTFLLLIFRLKSTITSHRIVPQISRPSEQEAIPNCVELASLNVHANNAEYVFKTAIKGK